MITEPPEHCYAHDVVTSPGYVCLKPGSSRVFVSLRNVTGRTVTIKPVVAKLAVANVVPPKLAPKVEKETENTDQETVDRTPLSEGKMKELFNKLDLSWDRKLGGDREKRDGSLDQRIQFPFCLG